MGVGVALESTYTMLGYLSLIFRTELQQCYKNTANLCQAKKIRFNLIKRNAKKTVLASISAVKSNWFRLVALVGRKSMCSDDIGCFEVVVFNRLV